ncbi:hypothetical protein SLEP1_g25614 [Rubroshorea leprosula]|uniref:Uncharacterized protein n=1 Tax=Rubroshorea leprosula TaxID=152421 RepID=A0AAV5JPZ9_9ROSI|nr:hypothetical protein SLEP1_g25614 [Rubroshorea leprosula]
MLTVTIADDAVISAFSLLGTCGATPEEVSRRQPLVLGMLVNCPVEVPLALNQQKSDYCLCLAIHALQTGILEVCLKR